MSLGLQNDLKWAVLCEKVLGRPDLTADERFATNPNWVAHHGELTAIIEAALGTMTSDEVVALLDEAGIASTRLRTPAEFAAHPQLAAREPVARVEHGGRPGPRAAPADHRARPRSRDGRRPGTWPAH